MRLPFYQVNAFTVNGRGGNPAGVILLEEAQSSAWCLDVASTLPYSETAFVLLSANPGLRWFSGVREVPLCGHATMGAAHALWELGRFEDKIKIRFDTAAGPLVVRRRDDRIFMDFPTEPVDVTEVPDGFEEAVGAPISFLGRGAHHYLAEVPSPTALRTLQPSLAMIARLPTQGLIVTSRSDDDRFDFMSRYFAPAMGVPEDPVTGSAHCALAAYWGKRLGRMRLRGYQASARGGAIDVFARGSRTELSGQAVTVIVGRLRGFGPPRRRC
jgi:PhzF family phenazine biosynthesis protein